MAREVGAAELAAAAAAAVVAVAITNELPPLFSSPSLAAVDRTARAALLEEAVQRALEPLLLSAQSAVTPSVVSDVRQPAAMESVACTANRSVTTTSVARRA